MRFWCFIGIHDWVDTIFPNGWGHTCRYCPARKPHVEPFLDLLP